jgi:SAM-dependent methyltransferase
VHQYSLENARKFQWGSVTGDLDPERLRYLEACVVGRSILDAGCGGGAYAHHFSMRGFKVVGVDKHPEFLDLARGRGGEATFVEADIACLPFPDKSFDTTICFDVLEHVDDYRAIIELTRVTRKRLVLAVPKEDTLLSCYGITFYPYQDPTHLRYYSEESLERLCLAADPTRLNIHPTHAVALGSLFADTVQLKPEYSARLQFHYLLAKERLKSLLKLRNPLSPGVRETARNIYSRSTLNAAVFQSIHTNLIALIELRSDDSK